MVSKPSPRSERQYLKRREQIYDRLSRLPQGTLKKRMIGGRSYYYLQRRVGKKVVHAYIGVDVPARLKDQLVERESLRKELEEVHEILRAFVVKALREIL